MKRVLKISLITLLVIFIGMQFFQINKENPPVNPNEDFLTMTQAPTEIATMIKTSCYDCHSHETQYPWYSNVAPVSWILKNHIDEGREHLNFSKWGTPQAFGEGEEGSGEALEEIVETLQKGEMPLWDYKLMHPAAQLSETQKTQLITWFQTLPGGGAAMSGDGRMPARKLEAHEDRDED